MKVRFDTHKYVAVVGKAPRGWGMWFFGIGLYQYSYTGTYAEAKRWAEQEARKQGETVVEVLG